MADLVDFYIMLATGKMLHKSQMPPEQWRLFYPVETVMINGIGYHLVSTDVMDMYVKGAAGDIRICTRRDWGAYRFFLHHNGRALLSTGSDDKGVGEQYGTTFGVVYQKRGIMHKFLFNAEGEFEMDVEEFNVPEPIM